MFKNHAFISINVNMKFIIYFENDFIGKINKHNFLKLVVGGKSLNSYIES